MAKTDRIRKGARLARPCCERWIDGDPNNVRTWRNRILSISSIQNEKLTSKLPNISIGPTHANPLIADNGRFCRGTWCATAQIVSLVVSRTGKFLKFFYVN